MKRVILDTNIYGRMVEKEQEEELSQLLEKRRDYGFDVVRKELRNITNDVRLGACHENKELLRTKEVWTE